MWGYPHFPPCLCLYLCPKPALSSCSIPRPDPGGQNCATVEGAKLREILAFLARETAKQTPLSQKVLWKIWWGKSWGRRASNAVYKPTQAQVHPNLRLHDTDTKKPSEAMIKTTTEGPNEPQSGPTAAQQSRGIQNWRWQTIHWSGTTLNG